MAETETPEALAADLERMPAAHRRQILAMLTSAERERLDLLLKPEAADSALPDLEAHFSPWLGARLKEAGVGDGAMTAATRQLLLCSARELIEAGQGTKRNPGDRRSLLQILHGALKPAKASA